MNIDMLLDLVEHTQTAVDRTTVNDPDFTLSQSLEKDFFAGTYAGKTGHFTNAPTIQVSGQIIGKLPGIGTTRTRKYQRDAF